MSGTACRAPTTQSGREAGAIRSDREHQFHCLGHGLATLATEGMG